MVNHGIGAGYAVQCVTSQVQLMYLQPEMFVQLGTTPNDVSGRGPGS